MRLGTPSIVNLTLSRLDRPTCHLRQGKDGIWRGAWLEHERMPIELELLPVPNQRPGAGGLRDR